MSQRVAVLHHERSFYPLTLARELDDRFELVWVLDAPLAGDEGTVRLVRKLGPMVDRTGMDADTLADALAELEVAGVVSFCDDNIELAAELADRLALTYHRPEVAAAVVDKERQRDLFRSAGIAQPRYWRAEAGLSPEGIDALTREVTFPLVAKPTEGSGSRGIRRVDTAEELQELFEGDLGVEDHVLEEYLYDDETPGDWVASYLSVESVVSGGYVSHAAVTGRFPLAEPFRETGNFIPALLAPALEPLVFEMVEDAVSALDIVDSVVHTEIKLTPDGPRLIEVNGRLAGRPPFVLNAISDVNLFSVACQIAVGETVKFDELVPCDSVGYWLMVQPPMDATAVESVSGFQELNGLDGVEAAGLVNGPGTAVDWREGTSTAVAVIRGRVADHDALARTLESIRSTVAIDYSY